MDEDFDPYVGSGKDFKSCNYRLYVSSGSKACDIILIISYSVLAMFLLTQMCRLCSKVFSYHKFHIHEAYRFYTVAFFSSVVIVIQKIIQLKLKLKQSGEQDIYSQEFDPNKTVIYGYRIMTEIMGVISISVTNIMYVIIGFTWLNIIWECDFNQKKQNITDTFRSIDEQPINQSNEIANEQLSSNERIQVRKESLKTKLKWGKKISFYLLYPLLLIFATFATLQRSRGICQWALVDLLISTELGYFLLGYSFILYLKKRLIDQQTPLYTKIIIVYLLLAMTTRVIWFNILTVNGQQWHMIKCFSGHLQHFDFCFSYFGFVMAFIKVVVEGRIRSNKELKCPTDAKYTNLNLSTVLQTDDH